MGDQDKSVKVEKEPIRRLSFANRLRLYGSLAGTVGLIALIAAGCGGKGSSGDKDGSPKGSGNTPGLSKNYGEEEKQDQEAEQGEGLPSDTVVDVELYSEDGSGDTYTSRMSFDEMQGLCEQEREETAQQFEGLGEATVGPIVTLPYALASGGSPQQFEYTCGD